MYAKVGLSICIMQPHNQVRRTSKLKDTRVTQYMEIHSVIFSQILSIGPTKIYLLLTFFEWALFPHRCVGLRGLRQPGFKGGLSNNFN